MSCLEPQPHTSSSGSDVLPYDLVLAGGTLATPGGAFVGDLAIRGSSIAALGRRLDAPCRHRIDARGLWVLPGLIDPHVHLGLPVGSGLTSEGITSATAAGLRGGVTTVFDFTLHQPGRSLADSLSARRQEYAARSHCDFGLHVNVTHLQSDFGSKLSTELHAAASRGARTIKIFTTYSEREMRVERRQLDALLRAARECRILTLVHAEDDTIIRQATNTLQSSHRYTMNNFARARPAAAEAAAIETVAAAAHHADCPIYFVHVSSQAGRTALVAARQRNRQRIIFETCPQYLYLDDSVYEQADAVQFAVTPPLRSPADVAALRAALLRGEIDLIGTDHCAFSYAAKQQAAETIADLPQGLAGIETRLPLVYDLLRSANQDDMLRLVDLLSAEPARVLGLYPRKGALQLDSDADVVLFDPKATKTIRAATLATSTGFSPYEGLTVSGDVRCVLLRGQVVVADGAVIGAPQGIDLQA